MKAIIDVHLVCYAPTLAMQLFKGNALGACGEG